MAHYMVQWSFNSETVSNLVSNPQDRAVAVRAMVERWGGKLDVFYYTFGDYDGVAIVEMPDNVSMVAVSMAISASGAFKAFNSTVLITSEEAMEAMRKASTLGYQAPGR